MIIKTLLKLLPYSIAVITGILFYIFSNKVNSDYYDLFINISAAFFAIPLLYWFYEIVKSFSHRKLNKELFDYAKMQIDRESLSILNNLQKMVLGIEKNDFSFEGINKFLKLNRQEIKNIIKDNKYLGFQILKNWEISEKYYHDILKNPFILLKLKDEQIISIIKILKSLRSLEIIQKSGNLYCETNKRTNKFKIKSGIEISEENNALPNRYLLLQCLRDDKFIVRDFGDISKYNLEKCLYYFIVNEEKIDEYSIIINELVSDINNWLDVTGKEFLIDLKKYRIRKLHG